MTVRAGNVYMSMDSADGTQLNFKILAKTGPIHRLRHSLDIFGISFIKVRF